MNHADHRAAATTAHLPWYRTWTGIACLAIAAAGALYLSLYHVDHALDALPFLILLLCPLMHFFMHGGHGHGGHGRGETADNRVPSNPKAPE